MTSMPLPPGSPKSRMMASGRIEATAVETAPALPASNTLNPAAFTATRKKRRTAGSLSTTSTLGPGPTIPDPPTVSLEGKACGNDGPAPLPTFRPDPAAMGFDDAFRDGQSQPCPSGRRVI